MSKVNGLKQSFTHDPELSELRELIRRYPHTVARLAREAGVSWGTIDKIDRGVTRFPYGITKIVIKSVCEAETRSAPRLRVVE